MPADEKITSKSTRPGSNVPYIKTTLRLLLAYLKTYNKTNYQIIRPFSTPYLPRPEKSSDHFIDQKHTIALSPLPRLSSHPRPATILLFRAQDIGLFDSRLLMRTSILNLSPPVSSASNTLNEVVAHRVPWLFVRSSYIATRHLSRFSGNLADDADSLGGFGLGA